ncbi:AraC family transcriptional regulator [bacterium]|nr:AraC family transcriptional regulator [bacterium]
MKPLPHSIVSETCRFVNRSKLISRLLDSELFLSYQKSFQNSTHLPLELHAVSQEVSAGRGGTNENCFCQLLNERGAGCHECLMTQKCLSKSRGREVKTVSCFAGLQETTIPIMVGSVILAHLKTGQVFLETPKQGSFAEVIGVIDGGESKKAELEAAYMATPVVSQERYRAMVTLLAAFSLQLTKLANHIEAEQECDEEDLIDLAKDYLEENFIEPIHLDEVAEKFQISTFHFCRRFKKATGITMTEYMTGLRVRFVEEALVNTEGRITDIAFNAGFQSLSHFNRAFHKLTGVSPTQYRKRAVA